MNNYHMEILDEFGNTAYTTESPIKAWAYIVAREAAKRNHEQAVECADLAHYVYLKDNDTIPIGHLVDVVAIKIEHLKTIKSKWDLIEYIAGYDIDYDNEGDF